MSFLTDLFGSRPTVPTLPRTNLSDQQQAAITANQAALPGAESLVGQSNLFTRDQLNQMIPGLAELSGGAAISDIESLLKGEIPTDVSQAVESATAARSIGGGYGGSGMGRNLTARDLGLTSLDLTQRGLSSAENWMRTMTSIYAPSMLNVSSMFVTPQQMYQTTNEQNVQQFQRNWLSNQIQAMPDPVTVGLWNTGWSVVDAVLSAYTGSNVDLGRVNPQGSYSSFAGTGVSDAGGGMIGSPSGPEGGMGGGGFGGTEGDFGAGFGGGEGGMV